MGDVKHPDWCQRSTCTVGRAAGKYAAHRSRAIAGRTDPATGTAVTVSLWAFEDGPANVLLEFAEGIEDGTDLTAVQALELTSTLTGLLAESGSAR